MACENNNTVATLPAASNHPSYFRRMPNGPDLAIMPAITCAEQTRATSKPSEYSRRCMTSSQRPIETAQSQ